MPAQCECRGECKLHCGRCNDLVTTNMVPIAGTKVIGFCEDCKNEILLND